MLGADASLCPAGYGVRFYKCRFRDRLDRRPPLSVWITSRHTGTSGERPHTALSDVGDPRQRHTFVTAFRLGHNDVIRSPVRMVLVGSASPDWSILSGSPPIWLKPRGESGPAHVVRLPAVSGPGQFLRQRGRFLRVHIARSLKGHRGVEAPQELISAIACSIAT